MEQRADVEKLNASLKDQLVAKGLAFETPDRAGFRAALSKAGFYKEWKDKFGAENWAVLESITGPLS
jgi:TRAP-type C4-dicarboxylate transport system substrate-binding protein